jgi:arsenite methyltransferase
MSMLDMDKDEIRQQVRSRYKEVALQEGNVGGCCSGSSAACCSEDEASLKLGYSSDELSAVPAGANLGLGCGNPQAIAELKPGETVLDLGSGGGFDCFLASRAVGESGRVIGVDMTPEMIRKARRNAAKAGYINTEFRLGEIEHLPLADESVDVIISNCVINLSPDKPQVFEEAFRVLKPGGRIAVSDVVASAELPVEIKNDMAALTACVAGASSSSELYAILEQVGFTRISIELKETSREFIKDWVPGTNIQDFIASAVIKAVKSKACSESMEDAH